MNNPHIEIFTPYASTSEYDGFKEVYDYLKNHNTTVCEVMRTNGASLSDLDDYDTEITYTRTSTY